MYSTKVERGEAFTILRAFVLYEIRLLEQSVINYLRPDLNNSYNVSFWVNWQPGQKIGPKSRPFIF